MTECMRALECTGPLPVSDAGRSFSCASPPAGTPISSARKLDEFKGLCEFLDYKPFYQELVGEGIA